MVIKNFQVNEIVSKNTRNSCVRFILYVSSLSICTLIINILGCQNIQRKRFRANDLKLVDNRNGFDPVIFQTETKPLKPPPTLQEELFSKARTERSLDTIGYREYPAKAQDLTYEKILAEQEKHKEILFQLEQYGIIIFALFFIIFNAFYWVNFLCF